MCVRIHGQRDLRMAEDLHYHSGWNPLCEQQRRARMPQIMKSTLIQMSLVQESVELMCNNCSVQWPAILAGEDQVERIAFAAQAPEFGCLQLTMSAKRSSD